jgi:AcrR family transcriptional regulator
MPRSKAANQQLRDVQRAKILDAARLIFSRKGPTATMDDIAKMANVSHGLAYRYFPNKDTIFQALVDEALQAGPAGLQHFEQMSGEPEDRLTLLLSSLIESRRERPEFYWLLDHVRSSAATPKKLRDQIRRQKEAFLGLLKRLIVEAQATGKFHSGDPDQLVMAVSAFLEGLSKIALHEPEQLKKRCPEPEIILRMLIRQDEKGASKVKR